MMERLTTKIMRNIIFVILLLWTQTGIAQLYKSTEGTIKFYSEELLEDITAINKKVKSAFNSESGQIVFSVPITAFVFDKSLMQEHFNEKYLESEKYPKATFQGTLSDYEVNQPNADVRAEGELEIHGVKNKIKVQGSLDFMNNGLKVYTVFIIRLADYKISIPKLMFQNIAEEIEVTVDIDYKAYEK
jgi:NTP pyrophosphatase (non-canonical NTP hydrolase)